MNVVEPPNPAAAVRAGGLEETLGALRRAAASQPPPDAAARRDQLRGLYRWIVTRREDIAAAISSDFGHRSRHESLMAEIMVTATAIRYAARHLRGWMRPRRRFAGLAFLPGRARVMFQPKGVVGIISPWNYPFNLAVSPLASALAAGNRVMLKPSEHTPATSALIGELAEALFAADQVAVVTGGPDVGAAFSGLPFDHLLYTGGTAIGRKVMRAAADNLTPVTLELGGKSPAIVGEDYPLDKAALQISAGKWLNAGQTCIAPDYVLVPEDRLEAFVAAIGRATASLYPTLADNPDYTALNNEAHYDRVAGYVEDARAKGARIVEINPATEVLEAASRKMAPTLVIGATDDMAVLREELFGPVLPVIPYRGLEQAIAYVNDRPRPLALYYFDRNGGRAERVLRETTSGGAAINETVFQFAVDSLPFGGVGNSGLGGQVHAREGFETFSHRKSVFYQSRINGAFLLRPPFGRLTERILALLT
jgi:coniferyl-aldehyde dehydrogenase